MIFLPTDGFGAGGRLLSGAGVAWCLREEWWLSQLSFKLPNKNLK